MSTEPDTATATAAEAAAPAPQRFPGRYEELRRVLTCEGWELTGPDPAPHSTAVEVYTFTAPYLTARGGLTGDAALIAYLRRIRLVLHTQAGNSDANLAQGHPGQLIWEVVAADNPDPDILLAAARAAMSTSAGAILADTRTTGEALEQRGWTHTRTKTGRLREHHYASPDALLRASYLPPNTFEDANWVLTTWDADQIDAYGQAPAAVVNALLLGPDLPQPAIPAPDTPDRTLT